MPHYVLTGPSHFWLSPCPWMANNRQQSQFWTYRLFKRRSGQTSHAYPYEKLLVKSAGQRSPIFEPRVVTYYLITVILHSSGFWWRAGYMGISPHAPVWPDEELTQYQHACNILIVLGNWRTGPILGPSCWRMYFVQLQNGRNMVEWKGDL